MKLHKNEAQRFPKPVIKSKPEPEPEPERKKADKGIESRTDRAEHMIQLVGNCFGSSTSEEKARDCMEQIELAIEKLKRTFNRKYTN